MNASGTKQYKSPRRKLVTFFEKSRDRWKAKCIDAKSMVKRLKNRIRYLESSKNEWKTKAIELEKELARMKAMENRESKQEEKKTESAPMAMINTANINEDEFYDEEESDFLSESNILLITINIY